MDNYIIFVGKDLQGVIPEEIQVIPFGQVETPKGVFVLDKASAQAVVSDFEAHKNDMVIDYEHQTLADPPVEAPAAGWIKQLINKGDNGIWAAIEWTDKARQYIANREYRYVSPVFFKRKTDNKVMQLINVALTNQPNIDGMVPLINKILFDQTDLTNRTDQAYQRQKNKEGNMEKELLEALGLVESATVDEAVAAINKLKTPAQIVANKGVLDALGLNQSATESEVTGTIMAMKQGSGATAELAVQLNKLTAKLADRDAADEVEAAVNSGKITPAQKNWATEYAKRDLAGFEVFVSKAPVVVFEGKIATPEKPAEGALDAVQLEINKLCGIDTETYKKYSPKAD